MATRPTTIPTWATGAGADLTPPTAGLQTGGWIRGLIPKASDFNWAWHWAGQWLDYLAEVVDTEYTFNTQWAERKNVADNGLTGGAAAVVPSAADSSVSFDLGFLGTYANQGMLRVKTVRAPMQLTGSDNQVTVSLRRAPKDGSGSEAAVGTPVTFTGPTSGVEVKTATFNHDIDPSYLYYVVIEPEATSGPLTNTKLGVPVTVVVSRPRGA